MKILNFTKMSGAGNDFVIMEAFALKGIDVKQLTLEVCNRTNGVGADGLLILDKSKKADYKMRIINADGSEAEMCGNGSRCLIEYIARMKKPKNPAISLDTLAGIVRGEVFKKAVRVRLSDPRNYAPDIKIEVNERKIRVHYIDTGVPHTIVFVDDLEKIEVDPIGRTIRNHQEFVPRGTNVNFVEQIKEDLIFVRTYERGVEAETKACGTGSVASAIVTYLKANPKLKNFQNAVMQVKTTGGDILEVSFDVTNGRASNVWLKGHVRLIAEGKYYF